MEICFNGTPQEVPAGTTVAEFLGKRNFRTAEVVAEVNNEILDADGFGVVLRERDSLNVFRIVAGG